MAGTATAIPLRNTAEATTNQDNNILTELDALKEKASKITDRRNPLAVMAGRLDALGGAGERVQELELAEEQGEEI